MNDKYLQFEKINDNLTELYIYGDIREPSFFETLFEIKDDRRVDAVDFKDQLAEVDTPNLLVRINSCGGSVKEALAIYGLLNTFKGKVTTIVDGFALSAASVIFMAGERRIVPKNGLLMIHNAWVNGVSGNYIDLKKQSEDLLKIQQPSVDIYCSKTGLDEETIRAMMDEEKWITSQESLEYGFATDTETDERFNQMIGSEFICGMVNKQKQLEEVIAKLTEENNKLKNLKIHDEENKNQDDFY